MSTTTRIMEAISAARENEAREEQSDGGRIIEDYPDLFWMDLSDEEIVELTAD